MDKRKVGLMALSLLAAAPCFGASEMFLKLDGVPGDAVDDLGRHKDEVQVLAWSWTIPDLVPAQTEGPGRPSPRDLSITKFVDRSSPALALLAVSGKRVKSAVLTLRKTGGREFIRIKLEDLLVTSVSMGGSGGEDHPTEVCALRPARVSYAYVTRDGKEVEVNWRVPDAGK